MRADRLLSLLFLLQTRGCLTARELSSELEVSERTIYRDLTALSAAGVPIYTERGPGGGISLLESYRTTMTGMTTDELRALFMLGIPAPLAQLGVGQELKSALLKLSAALPALRQREEALTRQRIYLDASWWFQPEEAVPCLAVLQQAVWQDQMLGLKYRSNFETEVEQVVAPYGLVAKANVWYLIYSWQNVVRALRVSRVFQAEILTETFVRPPDFDLAAFWKRWCAEFEANRPTYQVKARVSPALLPLLPRFFGGDRQALLGQASAPDEDGWVTLMISFESFEQARNRLLGFGRAVEVLEPTVLRQSVIDFARQIVEFYK